MNSRQARLLYGMAKMRISALNAVLKVTAKHLDQEPGDKVGARVGAAKLGVITMSEPANVATILDENEFLAWAQKNRPDQVRMEPVVDGTFVASLRAYMDEVQAFVDWEGRTVPGIGFRPTGTPSLRFTPVADAEELFKAIAPEDLPEIEGIDNLADIFGIRTPDTTADAESGAT